MKRIGEMIHIKPEKLEEYKYHHAHIWPEINAMIKDSNIQNYSIYVRGNILFAYYEYVGDDFEADMQDMAQKARMQEWWDLVKPFQNPLEDRAEGEWWASMEEVYHLD
ncbi:MAG: L-rhamnose mutarotase [Lachnospiraceae bacterium]